MNETHYHILIVDDERDITDPLASFLSRHGFRTSIAHDGVAMDRALAACSIDLIVLDIMMPGEDGLSICKRLQQSVYPPVILLTAMTDETDRIIGLEVGADDYLCKPFNPRELVARIKSVMRRSERLPQHRKLSKGRVQFDRWKFDLAERELRDVEEVVIRLSSGEHRLLVALIEYAGTTLSRDQLLDLTKGETARMFDRSVDNQISRLRQKIEVDPKKPKVIVTHRGGGYVFAANLTYLD
ncbi:response regulator [Lacimicrobium sp. SS2-24]|uniref:response regulator n=1 Tax=Lacimicrobium sp. SS2-24 TaxID=2005569 RepID=UPI000B4B7B27|nr:response regulator [Lacimicrobium sp. SS2-24]